MSKLLSFYGSCELGTLDGIGGVEATLEQRKAASLRAVRDVFIHLGQVLETLGRAILDYAVWYRENRPDSDTYPTCHVSLYCTFRLHGSKVQWTIVEFAVPRVELMEPEAKRRREENVD